MTDQLALKAYAKINLCLSVGAPEPAGAEKAGWHKIASWMQCIELFDDVTITRLPDGTPGNVTVAWAADAPRSTPIDWPIEKDLSCRALRALEAHLGRALPVSIEVAKRIPVGGGLGGGSSDAAAVLLGVPRLLGVDIDEEVLLRTAMSLGSDVGFFADVGSGKGPPRPALVSAFGDQIKRTTPVTAEIVLAIPSFSCSTPDVYKAFDALLTERLALEASARAQRGITGKERSTDAKSSLVEARWARMHDTRKIMSDHLFNDLAIPAYRVEPRLGKLSSALARATRENVHVTGSGSCLFIPSTVGKVGRVFERVQKLLDAAKDEDFAAGCVALRVKTG